MAKLGGSVLDQTAMARIVGDLGALGTLRADLIKFGPNAGRYVTTRPAAGSWAQLSARTDLLARHGVECLVTDVPRIWFSGQSAKVGSYWAVSRPAPGSLVGTLDPISPIPLLMLAGPQTGIASGSEQIFTVAGSTNPTQAVLPAGLLNNTRRRLTVKYFATKSGTTDPFAVLLHFGTAGTSADTTIYTTGSLGATNVQSDGELVITRIDATTISCMKRTDLNSTTAFAAGAIAVPNLDTTQLILSLAVKTGTTDIPKVWDCQMVLT